MYKVIISSAEGSGTNFTGEGSTIKSALNCARSGMEVSYGRGAVSFVYDTYKSTGEDTGFLDLDWQYLQTFSS